MPELPEVETIVRGLNAKVLGRTFVDIWTKFFLKNINKTQ
jgi:formamidopyrimidine-DNA glycosylase